MQINILSVIIATVLQFFFSAIWYTPVFGKLWGKIHGFDKYSKEVQQEMMKSMGPILGVQLISTFVTTVVLAQLLGNSTGTYSAYAYATLLWLGFVVPTQISAVLFGGTEGQWIVPKILIMAGGAFGGTLIATAVLLAF